MARITRKNPSFSNVQAGATATLEFKLGLSYHHTNLLFTGMTLAQMQNIRIEADGKPIKYWKDGERLNSENKYYGRGAATADTITMFFTRKELETIEQRRVFALGTSDVSTLSLLIDIHEDAVSPKLEAYSVQGNPANMGFITRIKQYQMSSAVAGEVEIDNIPLQEGQAISAIHLYNPNIESCELEINNNIRFESTKSLAAKNQVDQGRDPQSANKMTLDFILEGDIAQAIQVQNIQDFRLKPFLSQAGNIDIVVEYLEQWLPASN